MDRMRRNLVMAGLGAMTLLSGTVVARSLYPRRVTVSLGGFPVSRWGCQYQKIDLAAVARSDLDLIVLDPIVEGQRLRVDADSPLRRKPDGSRRLVVGYLSVGEAESYRPYWQAAWRDAPPPWLGPENPRWPGSFAVRYWHPTWQDMLLGAGGAVDGLIAAGFDGVFLDRVDAYGDWPGTGQQAQRAMITLVGRIAERLRARTPKGLVLSQNAEPLLSDAAFLAAIDAVSKESLLYNLRGPNLPNTPDDVAWSLGYLEKARAAGLPILAIEYLDDPKLMAEARARLARLGAVAFFGRRLLDELPGS
jgi:cysteinyl-tRNA synthetase, unknown class